MNNTPDNNTNIPAGSNKRSSPLLKVLPIAVLAAVLVYFAAQVYNYFADPMTITLVYEAQAEDVISMEGWLVRTEVVYFCATGWSVKPKQEQTRASSRITVHSLPPWGSRGDSVRNEAIMENNPMNPTCATPISSGSPLRENRSVKIRAAV